MAKIIFKNLEFVYDEPFLGRGRAWKYEVITHRNRDRKGGHIHRRWFETGEMKRHYRVTDRRKRYNQINEGIEDHFDALEDHGKEFDWRGYDQGEVYDEDSYQQYLDDLACEEEYERREMELDALYEREMINEMNDRDNWSFDSDYWY